MAATVSPTDAEVLVAPAMDRAFEAERAAQAAIIDCERQAADILERGRQHRRNLLERAQARIMAMHTRAAVTLEGQAAEIAGKTQRKVARFPPLRRIDRVWFIARTLRYVGMRAPRASRSNSTRYISPTSCMGTCNLSESALIVLA